MLTQAICASAPVTANTLPQPRIDTAECVRVFVCLEINQVVEMRTMWQAIASVQRYTGSGTQYTQF